MLLRISLFVAAAGSIWAWSPSALAEQPNTAANTQPAAVAASTQLASPSTQPAAQTPTSGPAVKPFAEPSGVLEPGEGKEDWIRLTSGEWLRGEIERMREDKLEFDSEELDLQTFDWQDVAEIYSTKTHTVVFEDLSSVAGIISLTQTKLVVKTADKVKEYPREKVFSILPGEPTELNWWSTKLSFGMTANAGNTQQVTLTASANVTREDETTRLRLDYDGNFGSVSGEENVNRHDGKAKFDVFVSRDFYLIPIQATVLHDKFQNIAIKTTPGAGVGYHALDISWVEWDLEAAGVYQYQSFISVEAGSDGYRHDAGAVLSTRVNFDIYTDDYEFDLYWATVLVPTQWGLTSHQGKAALSIDLNSIFTVDISAIYNRVEDPVPREDGTVPGSDDIQLVVGLGLELG